MHKSSLSINDNQDYLRMYERSINEPELFWAELAREKLTWFQDFTEAYRGSLVTGDAAWFVDGLLNVSVNCIDRHVEQGKGDVIAYYYESDHGNQQIITYNDLLKNVAKLANVLKSCGVKKGDRVCIYMPSQPESIYAMLACTRIGAVHTVVFAGFSEAALKDRIDDCSCVAVITVASFERGGKTINLLERVQNILSACDTVQSLVVVTGQQEVEVDDARVLIYEKLMKEAADTCDPEWMSGEDPLFILYTSGSTGKPKGVLHTTAGYLLYAGITHEVSFDMQPTDVYWSVADIGWITGHTYLVYGPLVNGCTSVLFNGIPSYPDASRHWQIIDRYGVTIYYSTPTVIRALMRAGNAFLETTSRRSLRVLGTVGEPINPEAWHWLHEYIGQKNAVVVDTWWQTETGGHALVPLPRAVVAKPGAAMIPFFGVVPTILDESGNVITEPGVPGSLVLSGAWPGHLRGLYNNEQRFRDTYLVPYAGHYFTGDAAYRDEEGYLWVTGRIDDVLNVAGRLIGTAELESAIVSGSDAVEAAVVAGPDDIKGSSVHAFVLLRDGVEENESVMQRIRQQVSVKIGSFAKPDYVHIVPMLPKTRSGKIMRRILRKIVHNDAESIGDTSTLAEPESVALILKYWHERVT
jgi:acetyl-CoA synthetase